MCEAQIPGAEKILYGLDDITGHSEIIIVEGEMDKLAMMEAGIRNVVSVPDGAPSRVKEGDIPPQEKEHEVLVPLELSRCRIRILACNDSNMRKHRRHARCRRDTARVVCCTGELDGISRVLLATDNDEPGQALAEELARRLGRERCWRVRWPQGSDSALLGDGARPEGYLKDANEVLLNAGADALRECVANAEPYPIRGLFRCIPCITGNVYGECV